MKGDFTRDTFDKSNHFSRVLAQQGRITIDADLNEQASILLHYLQTLARDVIGPYAAPAIDGGFALKTDEQGALWITKGRYYVDGLLVENTQNTLYTAQRDYPLPPDDLLKKEIETNTGAVFWLYLDVWERHVTWLDADAIREKALGGPDTSTRAKIVWQVRSVAIDTPAGGASPASGVNLNCDTPLANLTGLSACTLKARVDPGKRFDNPCTTSPDSKYRGAENQLYRVEIHNGGTAAQATFKWARDNGSVAAAWTATAGNSIQASQIRGFEAGQWIELIDETRELHGMPGLLVKLSGVDASGLTVDPSSIPAGESIAWLETFVNPKVRRWDHVQIGDIVLRNGAVPIEEPTPTNSAWIALEDGILIQFGAGSTFRTGDYWQIPARVVTGDIEWPGTYDESGFVPDALPPRGIVHHYAPLGYVTWKDKKMTLKTCRCEFEPLSSCYGMGSAAVGAHLVRPESFERAVAPSTRTPSRNTRAPRKRVDR